MSSIMYRICFSSLLFWSVLEAQHISYTPPVQRTIPGSSQINRGDNASGTFHKMHKKQKKQRAAAAPRSTFAGNSKQVERAVPGKPFLSTPHLVATAHSPMLTEAVYLRTSSYRGNALTPQAFSERGDFIQLNDNSYWKIRHRDRKTAKMWRSGDAITVETNSYFSWSRYKLINHTLGESIAVKLFPSRNGSCKHKIVAIDFMNELIELEDRSVWKINPCNLRMWRLHDDVVIAIDTSNRSTVPCYVLINPEKEFSVAATLR